MTKAELKANLLKDINMKFEYNYIFKTNCEKLNIENIPTYEEYVDELIKAVRRTK